jgi:hypothetical protein
MDAIRVIAETRKMLELAGDVVGLERIDRELRIVRDTVLASTVRASTIRANRKGANRKGANR